MNKWSKKVFLTEQSSERWILFRCGFLTNGLSIILNDTDREQQPRTGAQTTQKVSCKTRKAND